MKGGLLRHRRVKRDGSAKDRSLDSHLDRGGDAKVELGHLRVFVARPGYLLAMKCVAMRLALEELLPGAT